MPKDLDRSFESTYGFLKPEQLPKIDWTNWAEIEELYPGYYREQAELKRKSIKADKHISCPSFDLMVPLSKDDYIFKGARLTIEPKKRCALYGINGSGKTSLFQAITARDIPNIPTYMFVHHMKELEHNEEADKVAVLETVLSSHPLRRVCLVVEEVLSKLVAESDEKSEKGAKLKENLELVKKDMEGIGGYTGEKRAMQMLTVLGFDDFGMKSPVSSLSGGLRMRVALACAFFMEPDLLLLDEPTNHLDLPSVLWLENKLRGYSGSWVLVTHDRILLENVVTSVILIQDNLLNYYDCGFTQFEKEKESADVDRETRVERFLTLNRGADPSTPVYKTLVQYRDWRTKREERKVLLAGKFTFKSPEPLPTEKGQKQADVSLIKVDSVRFSYDEEKGLPFIFDTPISYEVKIGTRVGIMGPNGAGKSTFVKLITGKLTPTSGTITSHPSYTLAYFGQHSTKELKLEMSPMEFMIHSFPKENEGDLRGHLEKTSIAGPTQNKAIRNLSFSQRSCVIFAKLTYVPPHLLIMDEPTNFLDLDSVDSLIQAVNKFKGGLIIVTHNRDFLKKCCDQFLSIIPGAFLEFKTMKEAERSTYSFITALEEGKAVDFKRAIMENRGGGAVHSEEYLAEQAARLAAQQAEAKRKEDEKKAEEDRLAAIAAEKEAKRLAKLALMKTDWVADEACYVAVSGKWTPAIVVRNVKAMGVTVKLPTGKTMMVEAGKLRLGIPEGGAAEGGAPASKTDGAAAGGAPKAAGRGGARGGAGGGRGGARGGAAAGGRGGARGGAGGARGAARGGARGRGK